jgi:hypothetical protein
MAATPASDLRPQARRVPNKAAKQAEGCKTRNIGSVVRCIPLMTRASLINGQGRHERAGVRQRGPKKRIDVRFKISYSLNCIYYYNLWFMGLPRVLAFRGRTIVGGTKEELLAVVPQVGAYRWQDIKLRSG